ncbi:Crp/Fnr family transcriptional regulator [Thioclava sp. GXIMD2076]|uniref:Crp/Fnr family transcriptional regulator n=1 Tax=Thioclava kandeliae TaxID=3070818 RepID=A0ABV1SBV7_9RHOB
MLQPSPRHVHSTSCAACPLQNNPCFEDFSARELAFMEKFKTGEISVAAGSAVITEGAASQHMYTVLSGLGIRYKSLPNGNRQVLNFVFPGDFIGLQAAVMGEMCHGFEATTEMRLCVFDRARYWDLLRNEPERAHSLTWIAAREENFLGESLATIGQRGASSRIAWALLQIYTRQAELGASRSKHDGLWVPMPWKQQDLANALGMSLVHTNKTLAKLKRAGLAEWSRGWLALPDPERLAREQEIVLPGQATRPLL